jgi:hypothetical protein
MTEQRHKLGKRKKHAIYKKSLFMKENESTVGNAAGA